MVVEKIGEKIGPYTLCQRLGEGGNGQEEREQRHQHGAARQHRM